MPPRCFGHENKEEMLKARKYVDNRKKKTKYWKEKYGIIIEKEQYELFSQHSNDIKKIISILPFLKELKTIPFELETI
jgi:hypothetical protein